MEVLIHMAEQPEYLLQQRRTAEMLNIIYNTTQPYHIELGQPINMLMITEKLD